MTTILIVDDDADVRSLLRTVFALAGDWTVITAESVASAMVHLRSASVDVILTDNHLGDGCADNVRAGAEGLPVVVVSASVDGDANTLVPWDGYAGGISKPFNPMTLPALVASAMGRNGATP